jgi:cytochrome c-type biogenesis protein CcmI
VQLAALTLVFLVLLLILGAGFIAMPLVRGRGMAEPVDDGRRQIEREKELALQILRDLENDRRTGKIEQEDHDVLREEAEARAIGAMKRFDAATASGGGISDPIEAAILSERVRLEKEMPR